MWWEWVTTILFCSWSFLKRKACSLSPLNMMLAVSLCVRVCVCACAQSFMSDSLNPMDHSPPGSSVHGFFQARMLEWVVLSYPRSSSWSGGWTHVSCIPCIAWRILCHGATWGACQRQPVLGWGITFLHSHFLESFLYVLTLLRVFFLSHVNAEFFQMLVLH